MKPNRIPRRQHTLSRATWFAAGLLGCASPALAEIIHIDNEQLKSLLKQGVALVDVRTVGEWKQTGVVAGSQLVTLVDEKGRADPEAWKKEMNAVVDTAKPVILICRTGNRTGFGAKVLDAQAPNRKIYNVKAGITDWIKAGQPVVSLQDNMKTAGIKCSPTC